MLTMPKAEISNNWFTQVGSELNDCFHDIREPPTMNTIDSRYNNVTRIYRCIYNTIDTITDFRDNLMPQKLSEW